MATSHRLFACALLVFSFAIGGLAEQRARADQEPKFELLVVGPDGKPVPKINIEVRSTPALSADQVSVGKFVKKMNYGVQITNDENGVLAVQLPPALKSFQVFITTDGFGPYCARWSPEAKSQSIPAHLTAELDAGWSVGGIVVDGDGKPVAGARVRPSIEFKKPPDDSGQLGIGTNITTDAAGKWHFNSVPKSMPQVHVEISHPSFKPEGRQLTVKDFGIEPGQEPIAKIALDPGIIVTGKVTDEEGKPIAGALVRTQFVNDTRSATTGDDGVYRLGGCEPKAARIVVWAKGRATDMVDTTIAADMEPVNFQMKPGGTVRIRVLDEKENPVPKTRIFFQRWRNDISQYFEFDNVDQYTDKNGVWEWHEAPIDAFEADICPPDGMQLANRRFIARDEEYVFHTIPKLVISGSVIDAETKEPIKKFHVTSGVKSLPGRTSWSRQPSNITGDNKYQVTQNREYFAHKVKIEADGYLPEESRDIKSDEGHVTIDFALHKGKDVESIVLTPDGKPAAKAKIALGIAGAQIHVQNGDVADSQTYATRTNTDAAGKFHFSPQSGPYQLVITHSSGYALVECRGGELPEKFQLLRWAKVEGVYRIGSKTVAGVPIEISSQSLESHGQGMARIFSTYRTTTDKDGHFAFEQVPAGDARIGREIVLMVNEGATEVASSCRVRANFPAGETTKIDLGGKGRPVVGQLLAPKGFEGEIKWKFAIIDVQVYAPDFPQPAQPNIPADVAADDNKRIAWLNQWKLTTDEGKAYDAWEQTTQISRRIRDAGPSYMVTVDRDGVFRIDDMPTGTYSMSVRFNNNGVGKLRNYQFEVPATDKEQSDEILELGATRLNK